METSVLLQTGSPTSSKTTSDLSCSAISLTIRAKERPLRIEVSSALKDTSIHPTLRKISPPGVGAKANLLPLIRKKNLQNTTTHLFHSQMMALVTRCFCGKCLVKEQIFEIGAFS